MLGPERARLAVDRAPSVAHSLEIAHMLKRIEETGAIVRFTFDGQEIEARQGDTVAAALLAAGIRSLGDNPVSGAPRGPFCLMGACFDCMVRIDGLANRQACMTEVVPGMEVQRMSLAGLHRETGARA